MKSAYPAVAAFPLLFVLILSACSAKESELVPAPAADVVAGTGFGAAATVRDVELTASAQAWTGEEAISDLVTPIRVRIDNASDRPIRIAYHQFALVEPDGDRYSAIPPFEVVEETVRHAGYGRFGPLHPRFHYSGFYLSPYYDGFYSGIGAYPAGLYPSAFGFYPYHHGNYFGYWNEVGRDLPTRYMLEHALPEGVLEPDGSLDGFLYFEEVPADAGSVEFRGELVSAETGRSFAEAEIPFDVSETGSKGD
ncbi:MAG: hypothetical protein RRA92_04020 [Gemmatimonadota bacterium]|nr:hypothetical protein [Gemmatimonadota bacterium]